MLITTSNSLRRKSEGRWVLNVKHLRTQMDNRNLSQEQMGALINVERGMVSHWLKGNHQPTMHNYLRLCDALKVQP